MRNAIRLVILAGSVEDKEYRSIRSRENVHEAWEKLQDIHWPVRNQAYYHLICKLMGIRMDKTVQELSQRIDNVWDELQGTLDDKKQMPNEFKICILLNALPSDYSSIVMILQSKMDLTYDVAVQQLCHEELWRKNAQEDA